MPDTTEKISWRETGRYPKFFFVDARALFPLVVFLFHMSEWTFKVAGIGIAVFWALNMAGITPPTALRIVRVYLVGRYRPKPTGTAALRKRLELDRLGESS
jgi:intracellular multiplication protein IcmT